MTKVEKSFYSTSNVSTKDDKSFKTMSVILPTYNESRNIERMIFAVEEVFLGHSINGEIIIVDDNSMDRTALIAKKMTQKYNNIKIVVRTRNRGLSQSVVCGFDYCEAEIIGVIDCDFSHPPETLSFFFDKINEGYDIVIGTRYAKMNSSIEGWDLRRKILSRGANILARIVIPESTDPVSGFFAIKRSVIKDVSLRPRGYKIGLEILVKGNWSKYCEIPYHFKNRELGSSKLGIGVIFNYLIQIFDLIDYKIIRKKTSIGNYSTYQNQLIDTDFNEAEMSDN